MAFSHRITTVYQAGAETVINVTETVSGTNAGVDLEKTIAPGVADETDVMICPDKVQSMMWFSDQPLTIQTNDPNTPVNTINLKQNVPLVWTLNSAWPIPFALGTDITRLYLTNHGSANANVKVRVLSN